MLHCLTLPFFLNRFESCALRQVLRDLRHETALQHAGRERNQVAPEQGRFLAWLLETLGARRVIEVGVFTGYSSLAMALVRRQPELRNPPPGCLPKIHLISHIHGSVLIVAGSAGGRMLGSL